MPQPQPTQEHVAIAAGLVAGMHRNNGLAPVDLDQFWHDQKIANADPFGPHIPQCPMSTLMTRDCLWAELGIEADYWRYEHDDAWRVELNRAYNDRAVAVVRRRLLDEEPVDPARIWPRVKNLADVFEAKEIWHNQSWWLQQSAHNEAELEALLDRVEQRDIRRFILPENWDEEKSRLTELGVPPPLYRDQRGPVTFATSIYGVENLLFLLVDNPDLACRFRDAILRAMLEIARVLDAEAGFTPQTSPRGFYFLDDNCCLLNPRSYEIFGYPILRGVWDVYAPSPPHLRGQHSDSAMGHLLPILGRLDLKSVNFGPTLTVSEIREHCPNAVIEGQLAPFTFSRNQEENIVLEFLRDFDQARGKRGIRFATAGSVNDGSRLTAMRLIMAAIQRYGRY
jgi:uroporphyrinogen decarboxylase